MKKLILTLTTVIYVNVSYSQCDNPRVIEFRNGSTATYTGDMDDECKPEGEGKLVYNDPDYFLEYQSGTFKNGMLNGNGIVVYRNGIYFEGTYIDNEIVKIKKEDKYHLLLEHLEKREGTVLIFVKTWLLTSFLFKV